MKSISTLTITILFSILLFTSLSSKLSKPNSINEIDCEPISVTPTCSINLN